MLWEDFLQHWKLDLKVSTPFLKMEYQPQTADNKAAWDLYVELVTRISDSQILGPETTDEEAALLSLYGLFESTRQILKQYGPEAHEFAKVAILMLNQGVRPFTARWHRLSTQGAFADPGQCAQFRLELEDLQANLRVYCRMIGQMAGIEEEHNLIDLEPFED